jgi:Tn3 transposase DDE domain
VYIIQFCDDILPFIATIKFKETTASDIFRRLNSYSKQHRLYQALKAFGQILKSHFILRVIDELALRMAIERVLNGIEHVHRFTRAVSVGNPREFLQAEKQEQEMAEAAHSIPGRGLSSRDYRGHAEVQGFFQHSWSCLLARFGFTCISRRCFTSLRLFCPPIIHGSHNSAGCLRAGFDGTSPVRRQRSSSDSTPVSAVLAVTQVRSFVPSRTSPDYFSSFGLLDALVRVAEAGSLSYSFPRVSIAEPRNPAVEYGINCASLVFDDPGNPFVASFILPPNRYVPSLLLLRRFVYRLQTSTCKTPSIRTY